MLSHREQRKMWALQNIISVMHNLFQLRGIIWFVPIHPLLTTYKADLPGWCDVDNYHALRCYPHAVIDNVWKLSCTNNTKIFVFHKYWKQKDLIQKCCSFSFTPNLVCGHANVAVADHCCHAQPPTTSFLRCFVGKV